MAFDATMDLGLTPRAWQTTALERWARLMRGVVSVVTGGGKTVFALMCILECLKRNPRVRTLIVVPSTALLDQWYVSLREDLGCSDADIRLYSGFGRPDKPAKLNLLVINTARDCIGSVSKGAESFLVVDECHRAGSPENRKALAGSHVATLGLSATPQRDYDEWFEEYVVPTLGPIVYEYTYAEARAEGVVAPFHLVNVKIPFLPHERTEYERLSRLVARVARRAESDESATDRLKRLLLKRSRVANSALMRVPMAAKLIAQYRTSRAIVFHESIESADAIAKLLRSQNVNVAVYHTGIGPNHRRENLRLFRRGIFDCLVTCKALDEGTNVPEASIAVIASATRSRRQRIQRMGRVLRPAPGKDYSQIFTLYATSQEEVHLVREAEHIEDVTEVRWLEGTVPGHGATSS